jgi:pimeloyl-[acyl-carrier protein] methyl ester esterase
MARLVPEKVSALALVAATPCFVERADWPHAMKRDTVEEFARGLAGEREATLARFVRLNALNGKDGREAARAFSARLFARGAPSSAALEATLGWLREADLRAEAPSVRVPTLVVHGARDMIAPVEAGRWLARAIPGARLVEIADSGHLPFFTHRERFVAALESLDG